jgi:hypothetical protein
MRVNLSLHTALTASFIEQLLHQECMKPFEVHFDGVEMDDDGRLPRKHVHITFADPRDRDRFRRAFHDLTRKTQDWPANQTRPAKEKGLLGKFFHAVWTSPSKLPATHGRHRVGR